MVKVIMPAIEKDTLQKNVNVKNQSTAEEKVIIKPIKKPDLVAENKMNGPEFQVSPLMLSMIGMQNRSDFFEVETPKDSTIFKTKETINFKWESDVTEDIQLKIFNYKDELVFESDVLTNNAIVLENSFLPGAYTWKVEGEYELHHLGVFFVSS